VIDRDRSLPLLLLVDDYAANRQVARVLLTRSGYAVEEASDGQQALEAMVGTRFDAVLMDCEMPVLDGYCAAAEIRRREGGTHRTPIIALTASIAPADVERTLAAGMDRHVAKPVVIEQLLAALDAVLGLARAPQEPVLDPGRLSQLRRLYPDNRDLRAFADEVAKDSRARIAQLATAARAGDARAVWQTAHTLKASCTLTGAQHVLALLADVETRGRAGEAPDEARVALLQDAYGEAAAALAAELG
jgi:CheY-like chemotaxis protein